MGVSQEPDKAATGLRRLAAPFRPAWAALAVIVSAGGIVTNIVLNPQGLAQLGLPAWVWYVILTVIAFLAFGIMHYHSYYRVHPNSLSNVQPGSPVSIAPKRRWWRPSAISAELERYKHDLRAAREEIGRVQGNLEAQEALQKGYREQVSQAQRERDGWKSRCEAQFEDLRYGDVLRSVEAMSEAEYVAIRPQLEELGHAVQQTLNQARSVWAEIVHRAQAKGEGLAIWWLPPFVNDQVVSPMEGVVRLFFDQLRHGREPRPALARFYVLYRKWCVWMLRLGRMVELPTEWGGYRDWFEADRQFNAELQKKLQITQLQVVKDEVELFHERKSEGYIALPAPGRPL